MRLLRGLVWATWMEARHARLLWLMLILALLLAGAAELLAATLPTEADMTRLVSLAALVRVAWVLVLAVFVITSLQREESDRVQLWLWSLPEPRHRYLAARALGYASLAAASPLPLGLWFAYAASPWAGLAWALGLAAELVLVVLLSQAAVLTFRQTPAALATVVLVYGFARSLDALRLIATNPLLGPGSGTGEVIGPVLEALAWVVPPLARFAPSAWLINPPQVTELLAVLTQAVVTSALLYALMRVDIARRGA